MPSSAPIRRARVHTPKLRFEEQVGITIECCSEPMTLSGNLSLRGPSDATRLGYQCKRCYRRVMVVDSWPPHDHFVDRQPSCEVLAIVERDCVAGNEDPFAVDAGDVLEFRVTKPAGKFFALLTSERRRQRLVSWCAVGRGQHPRGADVHGAQGGRHPVPQSAVGCLGQLGRSRARRSEVPTEAGADPLVHDGGHHVRDRSTAMTKRAADIFKGDQIVVAVDWRRRAAGTVTRKRWVLHRKPGHHLGMVAITVRLATGQKLTREYVHNVAIETLP